MTCRSRNLKTSLYIVVLLRQQIALIYTVRKTSVTLLVMLLTPTVQTYAWGKLGDSSHVAELAASNITGFTVCNQTPYAELWMGTHPKGPSMVTETGEKLSEWIQARPHCVGEKVRSVFPTPGQLPFLFKVLSVNKSLSIQAHPDKNHAILLHQRSPDNYPDSNHKPEMAIALTAFEGLCGFRPKQEIVNFFRMVPELRAVVGESPTSEFELSSNPESEQLALRNCFTSLMNCNTDKMTNQLDTLIQRLKALDPISIEFSSCQGELLLRLYSQFPGDVGCFVVYFLNHMQLKPGEAMFLAANLPHAYLSGDCIECMACSDNVVRAGLTPKFKDVSTLCQMLSYQCKPACENIFPTKKGAEDPHVTVYDPPVQDFTVAKIQVPPNTKDYSLKPVDSASILLLIEGSASIWKEKASDKELCVSKGSVLFVAADEALSMSANDTQVLMFRAYCQL